MPPKSPDEISPDGNPEKEIPSQKIISAENKVHSKLHSFFKKAVIHKDKKTGATSVKLTVDNEEEFAVVEVLFSLTSALPWDNKNALTFTFDNHYDIQYLIEIGVLDVVRFTEDEKINEETNDDIDISKAEVPSFGVYYRKPFKSIPELFKSDQIEVSQFDDMTEEKEGEVASFHYGDTAYLYRQHRKKYRREVGGRVFRRVKEEGEEKEIEVSDEEQKNILVSAQNGNEKARNDILLMNIGLVYFVVLNISRRFPGINVNDLLQEGLIAMNQCIDKYDKKMEKRSFLVRGEEESEEFSGVEAIKTPSRIAKFSTYTVVVMEWKILDFIRDNKNIIRIPYGKHSEFGKVADLERWGKQQVGGERLTREDMVRNIRYSSIGLSEEQAGKLFDLYSTTNNQIHEDIYEVDEKGELVSDEPSPEDILVSNDLTKAINETFGTLTRRQMQVLVRRFGLFGSKELTLNEIGETNDVTKEAIRQIEAQAVRKLRDPSRRSKLREFHHDYSESLRTLFSFSDEKITKIFRNSSMNEISSALLYYDEEIRKIKKFYSLKKDKKLQNVYDLDFEKVVEKYENKVQSIIKLICRAAMDVHANSMSLATLDGLRERLM